MIDLTFCELREKVVLNLVDGRKLGRLIDMAFTVSGKIIGLIVPGDKKFFKNITGNESIFIPWKNIVKIGEDAILVELLGEGCAPRPLIEEEKKEKNCR